MKTLYILRHAKSSWSDPNLNDHDRPLNLRGERDKVVMAKFIKANFFESDDDSDQVGIDIIYTSSAVRALDYAACIHKHTGVMLHADEALYTFSVAKLLTFIHGLCDSQSRVALVTHNPAATEAINHLAKLGAHEKLVNLPTAAVAKLEFDVSTWSDLTESSGRVADFAKPKAIDSFEDDLD